MNLVNKSLQSLGLALIILFLIFNVNIYAGPQKGEITTGQAEINNQGLITVVNQSTDKAAINWQSFDISADETVNFNQPDINSITLNRILGNEKSIIDGALNANGQVWILNSNGVLFGKNAAVNTSGLLATTKQLSNEDFVAGNYDFKGESGKAIINKGKININNSGYAALLGKKVVNKGLIKAELGEVHLRGGKEFRLDLNGNSLVNLTVTKGELDALVVNQEAIITDGGEVYLTTNAVDDLLEGVVNNEGIVEAKTIDDVFDDNGKNKVKEGNYAIKKEGKITIFAHGGTAEIGGTLTTDRGEGFIETSGKKFRINKKTQITSGHWLIDPADLVINDGSAYETSLNNGTDIEIKTQTTGSEKGNIYVEDTINWNAASRLTLNAHNNIYINKAITSQNADGQVALYYGQDTADGVIGGKRADYYIKAPINLKAGTNFFTKLGSGGSEISYKVITELGNEGDEDRWVSNSLQSVANVDRYIDNSENYVLGANIDASGTTTWNGGKGFFPIGSQYQVFVFKGSFNGLGHVIKDLYINKPTWDYVGLFQTLPGNAVVRDLGLTNLTLKAEERAGGIAGSNYGSTIANCYVTGNVEGSAGGEYIGGIVGDNDGTITNSYFKGDVSGNSVVGGFVGSNGGTVVNSYFIGNVVGNDRVGGFAGHNGQTIISSYASGSIDGGNSYFVGGFVPDHFLGRQVTNCFWDIEKSGIGEPGSRIAGAIGKTTPELKDPFTFIDADWDFENIWGKSKTGNNDGHMVLKAFDNSTYDYYLKINDTNKTYGSINPTLDNVITGVGIENVTNLWTDAIDENSNAGLYNYSDPEVVSLQVSRGSLNEDYYLDDSGNLTIDPASLTVTAEDAWKTYDGTAYNGGNGITYSGFVLGEDENVLGGTLSYNGDSQGAVNAGGYTITPGGLTSDNYNITFKDGILTINPRSIIINADNKEKLYGEPDPALTYTIKEGNIVNNDYLGINLVREPGERINREGYKIMNNGKFNNNYAVKFRNGFLSILPNNSLENIISDTWNSSDGSNYQLPTIIPLNLGLPLNGGLSIQMIDGGINLPDGIN